MGKEANSITKALELRGINTKFSIPEGVDIVGIFQEFITLLYIPEEGATKDEMIEAMTKLSDAYNKEVLEKVCKIYADFCEEYGVKIQSERAVSAVKGTERLKRDEAMLAMGLELFT